MAIELPSLFKHDYFDAPASRLACRASDSLVQLAVPPSRFSDLSHLRGILGIGRVEVPAATPTIPRYFVALARALGGAHKDEARLCFPAFSDFVRVFGRRAGSDVAVGPCGYD